MNSVKKISFSAVAKKITAIAAAGVLALGICSVPGFVPAKIDSAIVMEASAASTAPTLSTSRYCEFVVGDYSIPMYVDKSLSRRGYCSPYTVKSNASSTPGDVDYLISIDGNVAQVEYPVGSRRVIGWCKLSDIIRGSSLTKTTATGKVTSYKKPGGASYGYFEAGDEVYIGGASGGYTFCIYTAKSGKRAYKGGWFKTSSLNSNVKSSGSGSVSSGEWQWPISNAYICGNGWSEYYSVKGRDHLGVDIKSSSGDTAVRAAAAGRVYTTGWNSSNGNCVVIEHSLSGKTVYSFYGHLKSINVSSGQYVNAGTQIGVIGNTGASSTGVHLHFGITTQHSTGTWGYGTCFSNSANSTTWQGYTYYNPIYVINYDRLP